MMCKMANIIDFIAHYLVVLLGVYGGGLGIDWLIANHTQIENHTSILGIHTYIIVLVVVLISRRLTDTPLEAYKEIQKRKKKRLPPQVDPWSTEATPPTTTQINNNLTDSNPMD